MSPGWVVWPFGLDYAKQRANAAALAEIEVEPPIGVLVAHVGPIVPAASGAPGESDVVAAIVPVDATSFDPASVFATCMKGLEPNFVPSYLQVVDEIPKTASEKPQERFLLDRFATDGPGIYRR